MIVYFVVVLMHSSLVMFKRKVILLGEAVINLVRLAVIFGVNNAGQCDFNALIAVVTVFGDYNGFKASSILWVMLSREIVMR